MEKRRGSDGALLPLHGNHTENHRLTVHIYQHKVQSRTDREAIIISGVERIVCKRWSNPIELNGSSPGSVEQ